jgi:predicted dehydrogenase
LDLVQYYAGDAEQISVFANDGGTLKERPGPNNFTANIKFKNGAIGRVLAMYGIIDPPRPNHDLEVYCTKGSVSGEKYSLDTPQGVREHSLVELTEEYNVDDYRTHKHDELRAWRHFENCIVNDTQPRVDAVQGAKTCALSYAGLESIETGCAVEVRTEF